MKASIILSMCFLFAACTGSSIKWTEDVLLPDGRVITLTRYQEFKGPHELGQPPTASDYWLEFKNPDTNKLVRWQHNRDLGTVSLMIDARIPYLLVDPNYASSFRDFNCPNPPYFLYRYKNEQWERVELKGVPVKKIRSNMSHTDDGDRKLIIQNNYHLSVAKTQDRYVLNMQPWVMDFSAMSEQSFGLSNCNKQSDYLLVKP